MFSISFLLLLMAVLHPGTAENIKDLRELHNLMKTQENFENDKVAHDVLDALHHVEWSRIVEEDIKINEQLTNVSSTCRLDATAFLMGFVRRERWAVDMIDSAGKLPRSILKGRTRWYGDYDSCTSIQSTGGVSQFTGQYCNARLGNLTTNSGPITIGICIPHTCTYEEWQILFNDASQNIAIWPNNIGLVRGGSCSAVEKPPFDAGTWAVACIVTIICLLVATGTFYDIVTYQPLVKKNGGKEAQVPVPARLIMAFSIYTNTKKLFHVSKSNDNSLACMTGIRFFSIGWVMLGHYLLYMSGGIENGEMVVQLMQRFSFQIVFAAELSVDTFFMLSGLLVAYLMMKQFDKIGGPRGMGVFGWVHFYVHRWWRLTPAVMFLAAIYSTLFYYTGEGPRWPTVAQWDRTNYCKWNWWTNLLYVNNLVNADEMCMGWTWYLANDMQFYVVSPLFLIPLYMYAPAGIALLVAALLGTIIGAGVNSTLKNTPLGNIGRTFYPGDDPDFFYHTYIAPWFRIMPHLIGMLTGYLLYRTKLKCKLPKSVVIGGWLLAFGSSFAVCFGPYTVVEGVDTPTGAVSLFNATFRTIWAACVAWVVFACVHGYGGWVNTFLSWKPFVVLSRLNYMAYMVHMIIQSRFFMSRKYLRYLDDAEIIACFMSSYVMAYLWAYLTSMTLEVPWFGIEKVILGNKKPGSSTKPESKPSMVQPISEKYEADINAKEKALNGDAEMAMNGEKPSQGGPEVVLTKF